jgi:hypothetical protein
MPTVIPGGMQPAPGFGLGADGGKGGGKGAGKGGSGQGEAGRGKGSMSTAWGTSLGELMPGFLMGSPQTIDEWSGLRRKLRRKRSHHESGAKGSANPFSRIQISIGRRAQGADAKAPFVPEASMSMLALLSGLPGPPAGEAKTVMRFVDGRIRVTNIKQLEGEYVVLVTMNGVGMTQGVLGKETSGAVGAAMVVQGGTTTTEASKEVSGSSQRMGGSVLAGVVAFMLAAIMV